MARMGESEGAYRILVRKTLGMRSRLKWEGNIKNVPSVNSMGVVNWLKLAQIRDKWWAVINAGMKLRIPQNTGIY